MHRLFVAIRPPAPVRAALMAQMGGVDGARWQSDDQLHLTLRFIGEVDRHRAEDVAAALGTVSHPAIDVALEGAGIFDRRGRIDTLWIGARPHAPLAALHGAIGRALARVGLPPEGRAFRPHVTLARFGRNAGDIGGFVGRGPSGIPPFAATDFRLYESTLGRYGSRYETIARYPLAPSLAG